MKSLRKDINALNQNLFETKLDYSRKVVDGPCTDIDILLDSLIYRNHSISFHLRLIDNHLKHFEDYLDGPDGLELGSQNSIWEGRKMSYLFDDIIFNSVSSYDYLATFIGYIFYGEEIRGEADGYNPLDWGNENFEHLLGPLRIIDWSKLANFVDENRSSKLKYDNGKIQASETASSILKWNKEFVYRFSELRHDIIHNKAMPIFNQFSYNPVRGAKYNFRVRGMFIEKFSDVSDDLTSVIQFIISNFSKSIDEICESLKNDIERNRQVAKGKEWIIYKHEM